MKTLNTFSTIIFISYLFTCTTPLHTSSFHPINPGKLNSASERVSIQTEICYKIISTHQTWTGNPFELYGSCKGKYDLLGYSDPSFKEESPICYDNLAKFFCTYYIEDSPNYQCNNEHVVSYTISLLSTCINNKKNNIITDSIYTCPTLNYGTYLVEDAEMFCKESEKEIISNRELTKRHVHIGKQAIDSCIDTVNIYNMCIVADNLLFPESNYEKCFNKNSMIYKCNTVNYYYDQSSKAMCSDYVLPTLTTFSLYNKFDRVEIKSICENFETKIIREYDSVIEQMMNDLKGKENELGKIWKEEEKGKEEGKNLEVEIKRQKEYMTRLMEQKERYIQEWKKK